MAKVLTPKLTEFIPHTPTAKQTAFLLLNNEEALYGGAAGGGKSEALLMAALQYVDVPGYRALLLRRTYSDLVLPSALLDRAHAWLDGTAARWRAAHMTFEFPSGATLTFGYLAKDADRFRYQSSEFQFIGIDELTQFPELPYRFLFSRLRRLKGVNIPLRFRSASNPGNIGHNWVKQRFIVEGRKYGRAFVPATLRDNPYLDEVSYVQTLQQLDPVTRAQMLNGDWSARHTAGYFKREWFDLIDEPPKDLKTVRYWDLAATAESKNNDPDWTVGVKMGRAPDGKFVVLDVRRFRCTPGEVEQRILQTAEEDGRACPIVMEEEGGASGKSLVDHYRRRVLTGFTFFGVKTTGSKEVRARPLSSQCEGGNVRLLNGLWVNAYLDELEAFPTGGHDDQVDATAGAFEALIANRGSRSMAVLW